jgi:hypothetical protein
MSYARALRSAAKRISDGRAAAQLFTEAARVHESLDDPGGAIALLTRAWDCDPDNAQTRARVAILLGCVATRVGLGASPLGTAAKDEVPVSEHRRVEPGPSSRRSGTGHGFNPFGPPSSPSSIYADEPRDDRFVDDVLRELNRARASRPKGDRLLGGLFEAMHTLRFVDDVRDGAGFVLRVVVDKTRARTGLVHLYHASRREFVVVGAIGATDETVVLDFRTAADDPFIREIVGEREAVIVCDPKSDPALLRGRWSSARPHRSVLCAAASREGRILGLIEIADPTDGSEFSEDDRNALTYVATAFAEFLEDRGVDLDAARDDLDSDSRTTRPELPISLPSSP